MHTAVFVLAGYLLGSVLFARLITSILHKDGALQESKDGNPGAANAYL